MKDDGNDLFPILIVEATDLQGLGEGNGGFDLCTNRESYTDDPCVSSIPNPSFKSLLLRRSVPEKSLSGMLMRRASFNFITSLRGSCNNGKTSLRHMSDIAVPSTSSN